MPDFIHFKLHIDALSDVVILVMEIKSHISTEGF